MGVPAPGKQPEVLPTALQLQAEAGSQVPRYPASVSILYHSKLPMHAGVQGHIVISPMDGAQS